MDQKTANKQFIVDFIDLYKQYPCLWRVKSAEYRDRNKKREAYEVLLKKYREMDRSAKLQTVKNKIDSLRGCFRKELRKIKDSQRSGEDVIYEPHLWYFNNLIFLSDQETPRESVSILSTERNFAEMSESQDDDNVYSLNSIESPTTSESTNTAVNEKYSSSITSPSISSPGISSPGISSSSISSPNISSADRGSSVPGKQKRKRKTTSLVDEGSQKVSVQLNSADEDYFDITAKNFAIKLRSLSPETAIITEKLMTDILFEAQMGNVGRHTKVFLQDTRQEQNNEQNIEEVLDIKPESMNNLGDNNYFGKY